MTRPEDVLPTWRELFPNGEELPGPFGRPYGFHRPAEYLEAIYASDRMPMGS